MATAMPADGFAVRSLGYTHAEPGLPRCKACPQSRVTRHAWQCHEIQLHALRIAFLVVDAPRTLWEAHPGEAGCRRLAAVQCLRRKR